MMKLSLTGVREIDAVLKGLPLQLQDRVLKAAHAEAAKPLVEAAKSLAPVKKGLLKESIGSVSGGSVKRTNEIGLVTVGPRRRGYKGFHGHLNEFGTKPRMTKSGAYRGVMPAKPFMEPAFQATKGIVEGRIAESIGRKLYAFMRRTIKKYG